MNKRGQTGKLIIFFLGIIILIGAIYFTFFFSYSCDSLACFQAHQRECSKTHFVNDAEDSIWDYKILGEENKACGIEVKVLKVKQGNVDRKRIEGKMMTCYLPLGDDTSPEVDIVNCHGLLKEELQEIIIEKLHLYVVENIGEISEELKKAV
ncbi:MAG: hypothetical protein ABFQ65_01715 [Nanoarchaeota archaeon]